MNEQPDKERFDRLLLGYVNGRLDETQRAWMERFVGAHPEVAAEVEMERALRDVLRKQTPATEPDQGLTRFMERLRSESTASAPMQSFWGRLKESMSLPRMTPAWVSAGVLLVAQTGIIGVLLAYRSERSEPASSHGGLTEWRSVGEVPSDRFPVLQLTFKPTATEAEMRLLLVRINGAIVGGPGQLGQYFVRVPPAALEATAKSLEGNAILESVDIRQEIPGQE